MIICENLMTECMGLGGWEGVEVKGAMAREGGSVDISVKGLDLP